MSDAQASPSPSSSRAARWVGWVLSVLPSVPLLMGAAMNLAKPDFAVQGTIDAGFPVSSMTPIGLALLVSTILYLVPRTSVIGAILLSAYLGGAVATHVRAGDPIGLMLVPIAFAVVLWVALVLRYPRLRRAIFDPAAAA